jgi:hypothetical protein
MPRMWTDAKSIEWLIQEYKAYEKEDFRKARQSGITRRTFCTEIAERMYPMFPAPLPHTSWTEEAKEERVQVSVILVNGSVKS